MLAEGIGETIPVMTSVYRTENTTELTQRETETITTAVIEMVGFKNVMMSGQRKEIETMTKEVGATEMLSGKVDEKEKEKEKAISM